MPARKEYTPEFKEQAMRFVFDEIEPDESRSAAVARSPRTPDLVNRHGRASQPNELWGSVLTYVATWSEFRRHRVRHRRGLPPHRRLAHRVVDDDRPGDG